MNKPITVERYEYMQKVAEVVNAANLPAFVKLEVLQQACDQLSKLVDSELKRDMDAYREATQAEQHEPEQPFTGEVIMGG